MEDDKGRRRRWVRDALVSTGIAALGVLIYDLLTRGFSWGDLVAVALMWAFLFLVVLFFTRPDRFGRDR